MHKLIHVHEVEQAAHDAYEQWRHETSGYNADYIPFLEHVDSDLFGLSICLLDGTEINFGDTDFCFGIESISKVFTAILALEQHGAQDVLDRIGADATGLPFNSIMAILLEHDCPSTPLVNAGAIAAVSMVEPVGDSHGKWEAITGNMKELCGGDELPLLGELYESEMRSSLPCLAASITRSSTTKTTRQTAPARGRF